jgi:hypothetical protein
MLELATCGPSCRSKVGHCLEGGYRVGRETSGFSDFFKTNFEESSPRGPSLRPDGGRISGMMAMIKQAWKIIRRFFLGSMKWLDLPCLA